jgi:hypothetical protein
MELRESSFDSSDEDVVNITVNKGLLFPNVIHKFLMANERKKKVRPRETSKYTTLKDEGSSSGDDDNRPSLSSKVLTLAKLRNLMN